MTLLIVEDDSFLANAYKMKLTKAGYEVLMASDGNEALDVLSENTPDVIVLDLIMPNMDGFALLERLQDDQMHASIPVIVASNLGQSEDIEKAKSLGARDYVIKTDMSLDELIEKVEALVQD